MRGRLADTKVRFDRRRSSSRWKSAASRSAGSRWNSSQRPARRYRPLRPPFVPTALQLPHLAVAPLGQRAGGGDMPQRAWHTDAHARARGSNTYDALPRLDGRELPLPVHWRERQGQERQAAALQGLGVPPGHPRLHVPGRRLHPRQRHRSDRLRPAHTRAYPPFTRQPSSDVVGCVSGGRRRVDLRCGHPTTWTATRHDGPNRLGL